MTDDQHVALAAALRGLQGMVVLSGYRSELYDRLYAGWTRIDGRSHADGARPRIESPGLSPAVPAPGLLLGAAHVGLDLGTEKF